MGTFNLHAEGWVFRNRGQEMLQFWTLLLTVSIRNARQQVQGDDGWFVSEYLWHKYWLNIYNHLPLIIRPCVNKKKFEWDKINKATIKKHVTLFYHGIEREFNYNIKKTFYA